MALAGKSTVKTIDGTVKEKLAFGWMLKTAVLDSTKQLWLEEEVSEPGTVDADVAPGCSNGTTDVSIVQIGPHLKAAKSNERWPCLFYLCYSRYKKNLTCMKC